MSNTQCREENSSLLRWSWNLSLRLSFVSVISMCDTFKKHRRLICALWLRCRNWIYWAVKWPTCVTCAEASAGDWLGGRGASSWVVTGMYSSSFSTALEHSFIASAPLLPSNCILIMRTSPCRNQTSAICLLQSRLCQRKQTPLCRKKDRKTGCKIWYSGYSNLRLFNFVWGRHTVKLKL